MDTPIDRYAQMKRLAGHQADPPTFFRRAKQRYNPLPVLAEESPAEPTPNPQPPTPRLDRLRGLVFLCLAAEFSDDPNSVQDAECLARSILPDVLEEAERRDTALVAANREIEALRDRIRELREMIGAWRAFFRKRDEKCDLEALTALVAASELVVAETGRRR